MKSNMDLFSFTLSGEEMDQISALNKGRKFNDPGNFGEIDYQTFFPIYE